MGDLPLKDEIKVKAQTTKAIQKEDIGETKTIRYKLGIQTVSKADATVDLPEDAVILGGMLRAPFLTKDNNGVISMGTVDVVYYLTKAEK